MKNIKKIVLAVGMISIQIGLWAQDTLQTKPFQITFFYPLGTNGTEATNYTNMVSFNVLYGVNGGLNGIEIGGLANANLGDVKGVQIASLVNIDAQKSEGIMVAGIANVVKDSSHSLCIAGISNMIGGSGYGFQFAGITNTVNGDFCGIQVSGISNVANGDFIGGQFSGISNLNTGDFIGGQYAGITNVNSGNLIGSQVSLVNRAKKVNGFQIGLINISEEFESGVPFGLINFVKKGYHAIEIAGGESIFGNVNLKLGVDKLYTIYKLGYALNEEDEYFSFGFGFGTKIKISEKIDLSIDLSNNQIVEPTYSPKFNNLTKADFSIRYNLGKHISLFAGPSFNVYVSEYDNELNNTGINIPYEMYKYEWWNEEGSTSIWIGANAGVSFQF